MKSKANSVEFASFIEKVILMGNLRQFVAITDLFGVSTVAFCCKMHWKIFDAGNGGHLAFDKLVFLWFELFFVEEVFLFSLLVGLGHFFAKNEAMVSVGIKFVSEAFFLRSSFSQLFDSLINLFFFCLDSLQLWRDVFFLLYLLFEVLDSSDRIRHRGDRLLFGIVVFSDAFFNDFVDDYSENAVGLIVFKFLLKFFLDDKLKFALVVVVLLILFVWWREFALSMRSTWVLLALLGEGLGFLQRRGLLSGLGAGLRHWGKVFGC